MYRLITTILLLAGWAHAAPTVKELGASSVELAKAYGAVLKTETVGQKKIHHHLRGSFAYLSGTSRTNCSLFNELQHI
jgi:hypothetical protein